MGDGNIFAIRTDADSQYNVITPGLDRDYDYDGFGFHIQSNGTLTFCRLNISDSEVISISDNINSIATLSIGSTYSISLASSGSTTDSPIIGRGTDNFTITLMQDDTLLSETTVAGFGLNGVKLESILIGDADSSVTGTVSDINIYTIPEPSTATLSLLALSGLLLRRRRSR